MGTLKAVSKTDGRLLFPFAGRAGHRSVSDAPKSAHGGGYVREPDRRGNIDNPEA
jgi:hypothetical protein